MSLASSVYAQNSITSLNASDSGNGTTVIKVEFARPLANLPAGAGVTINNPDTPPRVVLDFPDMTNGLGISDQEFNAGSLRNAKITQAEKGTRLVINLDRMLPYTTKVDANSLLIVLEGNTVRPGMDGNAPQEARTSTETKTQAQNPATPFVQPGLTPAKRLMGVLLQQATALIRGGKPADAYNLLEPKEADYSGEIAFDYLLGMAALDSGKPDRATIAFERVLAVNPNFAGARLDLARAYFAMGSDDLAKKEFETVLNTQNPPGQVVAVIKKHLDAIEERQQAKIQQVTAYLETSVGHDNNITAATGDNTAGVAGILGMTRADLVSMFNYEPTGSSLHYSGTYTAVAGGVDFNRLVSEEYGVSIFAGADVKQRVYNKVSAMNNLNTDLRAGVALASGDDSYRLTATFGQYRQSGFSAGTNSFRDTAGFSAEWKRSFGDRDQMTWSVGYSEPRYITTQSQNTRQVSLSGSWLHIFEGKMTPLIFANANRSIDDPANGGSNMGRNNTGVLAHLQFTPFENTDFSLSGGTTVRHDSSPGARSPGLADFYARDETQSLSFGVTTRPWKQWTIKGSVALTNNRSNLSLYQYRRNDSSVSLRRDF